jgi:hypothetical protein
MTTFSDWIPLQQKIDFPADKKNISQCMVIIAYRNHLVNITSVLCKNHAIRAFDGKISVDFVGFSDLQKVIAAGASVQFVIK